MKKKSGYTRKEIMFKSGGNHLFSWGIEKEWENDTLIRVTKTFRILGFPLFEYYEKETPYK